MAKILCVLRYVRYKGCQIKEPNLRFKGAPLVAQLSGPLTAMSNTSVSSISSAILVLLKVKFYVYLQVQHRVPPQVHFLMNLFKHSFLLTSVPSCASSSAVQL